MQRELFIYELAAIVVNCVCVYTHIYIYVDLDGDWYEERVVVTAEEERSTNGVNE